MENCELCKTPKNYREHIFKIDTVLGKKDEKFTAYTYKCVCPLIMFEELIFIKDYELELNENQLMIIKNYIEQKSRWIQIADKAMKHRTEKDRDNIYNAIKWYDQIKHKKEDHHTEFDHQAFSLYKDIWSMLYKIKDDKARSN